jgi:hypothetical protein
MFEHWKELVVLGVILIPIKLLMNAATKSDASEEQSKRLFAVIGIIIIVSLVVFAIGMGSIE